MFIILTSLFWLLHTTITGEYISLLQDSIYSNTLLLSIIVDLYLLLNRYVKSLIQDR